MLCVYSFASTQLPREMTAILVWDFGSSHSGGREGPDRGWRGVGGGKAGGVKLSDAGSDLMT